MIKPKIAFVVQRNGKEVNGGSESHCFTVAEKMKIAWDVEILTTCALDYVTWENFYPEGIELIDDVPVRRFRVDYPRNKEFNAYSDYIYNNIKHVTIEECEKWMNFQGPVSSSLIKYIENNKENYEGFIFFTYLYATTYYGLPPVKDKALLVPTAHDEWTIYLPLWNKWFENPRAFIFNTLEEKKFLEKRFPSIDLRGEIVGVGINCQTDVSENRFRKRYKLRSPYILYTGRIDESKGCKELFDFFKRYKKDECHTGLKLVLIGRPVMEIPVDSDIVTLGFVDEETKFDAIKGCEFLINPSHFESLSIVLLEAWSLNKPVLVTEKCNVTVEQCKRSNGGLWYENYDEFRACVNYLLNNKNIALRARDFIDENYSWDLIRKKYVEFLEKYLFRV